jgi:hypothetical protein
LILLWKRCRALKLKGFNIVGYDPFYFPEYPIEKFDTIICFYVLKFTSWRASRSFNERFKSPETKRKVYFAVRRDIQYEGFRIHKIHKKETYQCLIRLAYLFIKNENCEIYEYEHYTTLNKGRSDLSPFFEKDLEN